MSAQQSVESDSEASAAFANRARGRAVPLRLGAFAPVSIRSATIAARISSFRDGGLAMTGPGTRLGVRVRTRGTLGAMYPEAAGFIDEVCSDSVFVTWDGRRTRDMFRRMDALRLLEIVDGPSCGLASPICPRCIGELLDVQTTVAGCFWCGRSWDSTDTVPCPWPAEVEVGGVKMCRSHGRRAALQGVPRLVAEPASTGGRGADIGDRFRAPGEQPKVHQPHKVVAGVAVRCSRCKGPAVKVICDDGTATLLCSASCPPRRVDD
jgi:hypothetical protein